MSDAESRIVALMGALDESELDVAHVERTAVALARSLATLSRSTPRDEVDRITALHACLRDLVARRRDETARALAAVQRARAQCARLTRPQESHAELDVRA